MEDRILNVGIIGLGEIAAVYAQAYKQLPNARVVAVCDQRPERAKDLAMPGRVYTAYRDLLADPEVDAVNILLPTMLHPEVTTAALEAGKDVLCEKPMALSVDECDRMIEAARRTGKTLMIAHCLRFWPEYVELKRLVDSGQYGRILHATFHRVFAQPKAAQGWFTNPSLSGGAILDLHVHDVNYITYLLGTPESLFALGHEDSRGVSHVYTLFRYPDGTSIAAEGGWSHRGAFSGGMGFRVCFEGASVQWDSARCPMVVSPNDAEAFHPELSQTDGYAAEVAHFLDCVATGCAATIITAEDAADSIRLVQAELASIHTGQAVELDWS